MLLNWQQRNSPCFVLAKFLHHLFFACILCLFSPPLSCWLSNTALSTFKKLQNNWITIHRENNFSPLREDRSDQSASLTARQPYAETLCSHCAANQSCAWMAIVVYPHPIMQQKHWQLLHSNSQDWLIPTVKEYFYQWENISSFKFYFSLLTTQQLAWEPNISMAASTPPLGYASLQLVVGFVFVVL